MKTSNINMYEHDGNWFFKVPGMTNSVGPFMTKLLAQVAISELPDAEPTFDVDRWPQDYQHTYFRNPKNYQAT